MLAQAEAVGLSPDHRLSDHKAAPNPDVVDEFYAVCTDDFMHWSRSPITSQQRLAALDQQWSHAGLFRRPEKDTNWSTTGTAIGCDFDGVCGFLDPGATKQVQVMWNTLCLLSADTVTPEQVMVSMGSLQWFDLLSRSKLSIYNDIYDFAQLSGPSVPRTLPSGARSELLLSIVLAPCWSASLSREHLPFVSATDASTTFGFGACTANVSKEQIREISRFSEKRGDFVVLEKAPSDEPAQARQGIPRHLGLSESDFATIFSVKARHKAHINILEAEAYLLWLRWLLRSRKHHGTRATCFVDSKVVLGGVAKGRSSSRPLLRVLRKIGALHLAGDILPRLIYIPTSSNPSDAASRGIRKRPHDRCSRTAVDVKRVKEKRARYNARLEHEIARSPYINELRALTFDDPDFWRFR
jgi:hypothetical protein